METQPAISISDKYELIALHRSLFEAQFAISPHDPDVPGSPILAALANRVVEALSELEPGWTEWRQASGHPDRVNIVRRKLACIPGWDAMSQTEREMHVRNHLAPLIPDQSYPCGVSRILKTTSRPY